MDSTTGAKYFNTEFLEKKLHSCITLAENGRQKYFVFRYRPGMYNHSGLMGPRTTDVPYTYIGMHEVGEIA